jgi:hypothetical protein
MYIPYFNMYDLVPKLPNFLQTKVQETSPEIDEIADKLYWNFAMD